MVSVSAATQEHSSVDLQHCHAQGRPTELVDEDVTVETGRIAKGQEDGKFIQTVTALSAGS